MNQPAPLAERAVKMPSYAGEKVNWLCLLAPDIRPLEVYSLSDGHWLLEGARKGDAVHAPFVRRSVSTPQEFRGSGL